MQSLSYSFWPQTTVPVKFQTCHYSHWTDTSMKSPRNQTFGYPTNREMKTPAVLSGFESSIFIVLKSSLAASLVWLKLHYRKSFFSPSFNLFPQVKAQGDKDFVLGACLLRVESCIRGLGWGHAIIVHVYE